MKVKICGITSAEDIKIVNACKPDFAGFVMFFPKSKRNISPKTAKSLIETLDKNMLYVPYSEIDDADYSINDEDRKLNHKFYGDRKSVV